MKNNVPTDQHRSLSYKTPTPVAENAAAMAMASRNNNVDPFSDEGSVIRFFLKFGKQIFRIWTF